LTERNQIALLDLGMVARVAPGLQERLLNVRPSARTAEMTPPNYIAIRPGEAQSDETRFRINRDIVAQHHNVSLKQIQIGRMVLEVTESAAGTAFVCRSK